MKVIILRKQSGGVSKNHNQGMHLNSDRYFLAGVIIHFGSTSSEADSELA